MSRKSEAELKPREGSTLVVAVMCRISGCENQKEVSLEDQEDNAREVIAERYSGPTEFHVIATTGKGERLDRPELEEIEAAYLSGSFDVVVYDELSRLIRGGEAARLLGVGVDNGTRSICIADGIDTVDDTWEEDALNACGENVAHNQRTSQRIKQKSMNRFRKSGFTAARQPYGYIVPAGAKSFDNWQKDPEAEPFILEGARILSETLNGEVVAEYFRENQVPVGKFATNATWDGTMVLRLYRNPLLKGMPQRGRMATVKHHGSGKRQSKLNPKGPTFYEAPHLAYLEPAVFDDLNARLAQKNRNFRRKAGEGSGSHPCTVSHRRPRFPSQHARCWYCGRHYVGSGIASKRHLMCSGAYRYQCWNSIHIDGRLFLDRIRAALTDVLYELEGFDAQFQSLVAAAYRENGVTSDSQIHLIRAQQAQLAREKDNLLASLKQYGPMEFIDNAIKDLLVREQELERRHRLLALTAQRPLRLPRSISELRTQFEARFQELGEDSLEFSMLLQKMAPEMHVYLVQMADGGPPLARARVKLAISGIAPDVGRVEPLDSMLTRELTIDLFERPTERERIRERAVELASTGLTYEAIARAVEPATNENAVGKALALQRQLDRLGLSSPYMVLQEPPADYLKLRRHRHSKYRFASQDGYLRPNV